MCGACSWNEEKRNAYRLFVGKPKGRRPLEDQDVGGWIILGMDFLEVGWDDVNWIGLAQDRVRLRSCFCGEPSLTRGRVCNLQCNHSMVREYIL
jgi:hypothetical protein